MKKNKYSRLVILFLAVLSSGILSCTKKELVDNTPDQLFRPAMFTASIDANEVTFSWVPIADATYFLQISRDSLVFSNDVQEFSINNASSIVISDLWSSARYSARIKAVSKNSSIKNSEYNQITFRTAIENIFYEIGTDDISSTAVLLKWDASKRVTDVTVSATSVPEYKISLLEVDMEGGQKLVESLQAGKSYTFKIYNGDMLRGTLTVTTKA